MLLDELKIEQDDLKVGDVVYTSHHPNIGVWVSFRYFSGIQKCEKK